MWALAQQTKESAGACSGARMVLVHAGAASWAVGDKEDSTCSLALSRCVR